MNFVPAKLLSMVVLTLVANAVSANDSASTTESFFIDLPADGIAMTHGGGMFLTAGPPGIALLAEPGINNGLALLVKLRDAGKTVVGFASELETFPAKGDPLHENIIWETDWTLMIPGRGSLYLHQQEHSGDIGARIINPVLESGTAWQGEWTVTTTVGPRPDGLGVIVGGAGEYAGANGTFVEIVTLTGFELPGVMIGSVELRLTFNPAL